MKKFLLKVVLFLGLCGLFFVLAIAVRIFSVRAFKYEISESVRVLFVGDSRFRTGVEDKSNPHILNVSADADNYMTAYLRIKFILSSDNSVKTIFIVFSPDIMGENADERLFANYLMAGKVPQYFPLYSEREWQTYFSHSPKKLLHNVAGRPFRLVDGVWSQSKFCENLGSFRASTGKNLKSSVDKVQNSERKDKPPSVFYGNYVSMMYLNKIREYCREHNIRLIGIAVPHYLAGSVFNLKQYRKALRRDFPDLEVWDYLEMSFPEDCWQDVNHLNCWGAEIFTKELCSRMKKEGILPE